MSFKFPQISFLNNLKKHGQSEEIEIEGNEKITKRNSLGEDTLRVIITEEGVHEEESYFKENDGSEKAKFESLKFGEETYRIFIEDAKYYTPSFLEDCKLLVAYIKNRMLENAYYDYGDRLLILETYDTVVMLSEVPIEDDMTPSDAAEVYFSGRSNSEIDLSIDDIKSEFTKKSKTTLYLFVAVLIVFSWIAYSFLLTDDIEVVKAPPPQPVVNPLTEVEKNHLARGASLKLLELLDSEIKSYKEGTEDKELRRVISFSMSSPQHIPPVQPQLVNNEVWVYPPGPKRGGIKYDTTMILEQIFIGEGFRFSQDDLYSKTLSKTIELDETYLEQNILSTNKLALSRSCLVQATEIEGVTTPIRRDGQVIELRLEEAKGSIIKNQVLPLIKSCPVIVDYFSQKGDEFTLRLLLYKANNDG